MSSNFHKINRIPRVIIMLGVVSLFTDVSTEMIYPLIPVFIAALGSGAVLLGIIEGMAQTTASLLNLVSGLISDRIGKRKLPVVIGYAISSFIRPLTGVVSAAWQIILIRMADRVGKGIRTAPRDAIIAGTVNPSNRGRAFGFERAMDHAGAVIGPVTAILVLILLFLVFNIKDPTIALRWTFGLALIPGLLAVLTITFFVRESTSPLKKQAKISLSLRQFNANFRNYLLVVVLFTLGNSSDAFLLFRVEEAIKKSGSVVDLVNRVAPFRQVVSMFGSESQKVQIINILFLPLVWAFFHVIKVAFSTRIGQLSDRAGRKVVISTGWFIYAFVYIAFGLLVFLPPVTQVVTTFALFAIYALFYSFTEGPEKAFVADLVPDENRGTAYGLYNLATGIGALPASVIFGFLYSFFDRIIPGYGGTVAFFFGALLALLSVIILGIKVKEPERQNS